MNTTNEQPNILLILCDQMRLSCLSSYGETPCKTPHLEELAAQSVIFDNAYTPCPLCTPARASIITGLMPHEHGMNGNCGNTGCAVPNLLDRPDLLSRKLQGAGYDCLYSGKWHLGTPQKQHYLDEVKQSLPRDIGFRGQNFPGHGGGGFNYQEYTQWLESRSKGGYQPREWKKLGKGFVPNFGIIDIKAEDSVPAFLVDHSISCMKESIDNKQPFFCWHNFWGPHEPYFVPEEYYNMYKDVEIPEWPNYRWDSINTQGPHQIHLNPSHPDLTWEDWAEAIRHYYAFMTLIDEQIGRMLNFLEEQKQLDNTLIIFTADHGESLGSHGGLLDKGVFHFEEIQRIPFLMRLPQAKYAGSRNDKLISLIDIFPTCCESADADYDSDKIAGMSLHSLLADNNWREDLIIESEGVENCNITLRTLRYQNWKYCFSLGMREELYDLDDDPHEMNNLIASEEHQTVLNKLRSRLVRKMKASADRVVGKGVRPALQLQGWTEEAV